MAMTRECLEAVHKSVVKELQEQIERLELRLAQLEFAMEEILGDTVDDMDDEVRTTYY